MQRILRDQARQFVLDARATPQLRVEPDEVFEIETWEHSCALCGSRDSFLDEMIVDDEGRRLFVCSDTDYCQNRREGRRADKPQAPAKATTEAVRD